MICILTPVLISQQGRFYFSQVSYFFPLLRIQAQKDECLSMNMGSDIKNLLFHEEGAGQLACVWIPEAQQVCLSVEELLT